MKKTIAAISTPRATGGISVIRISGEEAISIADKVFSSVSMKKLCDIPGYTALFGDIKYESETIDQGVALVFRAPKSYTGEDVVEISCHGGILVTEKVLRAVFDMGAYPAEPGEFTKRAFLNGKMSLTQAEAVTDLINAESEKGLKAAQNALKGALYKKIKTVLDDLLSVIANIAAFIDYPDEDIDDIGIMKIKEICQKNLSELDSLLNTFDRGKIIREGIETVIVGKPNVGKSTLMNLLAGCQKSIVTDIPGTTRDVVEEAVNIGDVILRLADTAGVRQTDDIVEKAGVERTLERLDNAELVLAVFDFSSPLDDTDLLIIKKAKNIPSVAIINKTDLEENIDKKYIYDNFKHIVEISAVNNEGIDALNTAVSELLRLNEINPSAAMLANERQYYCVSEARKRLSESLDAVEMGFTMDAVGINIETAISVLLELTGEKVTDAVVNEVFSQFCVGK